MYSIEIVKEIYLLKLMDIFIIKGNLMKVTRIDLDVMDGIVKELLEIKEGNFNVDFI